MFSIFKKAATPESFWDWFKENQQRFTNAEDQDIEAMMEMGRRLRQVERGLSCDVVVAEDGTKELQLTGDGNPDLMPALLALTELAPNVAGWRVVPFRQRSSTPVTILFEDRIIRPEDLKFSVKRMMRRAKMADLEIAVEGISSMNASHLAHCATLLMEGLIGELDLMTHIRDIEFAPLREVNLKGFHPLTALPDLIADLKSGLETNRKSA